MSSIQSKIDELEQSVDCNQIRLFRKGESFEVYPWIKPYIFSVLQQGNKPVNTSKSYWFQLKIMFNGFMKFRKKSRTVFFTSSLEKRMLDGKAYDKLFHELSSHKKLAPAHSIELILPGNHFSRSEYKNQNSSSRSLMMLRELVYSKLFLRKLDIQNHGVLSNFLQANGLSEHVITSAIKKNYAQYVIMKRWLKRNKVSQVFLTVSYTNFGRVLACKEMGIPVVEVQHGVINEQHYGYYYSTSPSTNQFPDYLLTFGKADEQFIDSSVLGKFIKPIGVGSFILDYYSEKVKQRDSIDKVESVAVSLQDCETGTQSISDLIQLANELPEITFHFKRRNLGPEYYEQFEFPKNVQFEEQLNVYELILNCDLHLTAYSSCALEALTLGRSNVLFNKNNKAVEYYSDKLKAGIINQYCNSVEEMKKAIVSIKALRVDEIKASNEQNFSANYFSNIDRFVNRLLESNE